MAPKNSSSTSPLVTANFITSSRLVTVDLNLKPYSRSVVGWLIMCGLLRLCTFNASPYSLQLANEFYSKIRFTKSTEKLQGTIRGYEITISSRSLARLFNLLHDDRAPISLFADDLKEAQELMRPGAPMSGRYFTRKEFSPEIYLLSDIIDKVLMCKIGNKDKFTEQQHNLTLAILLRKNMNWAGLLLHQLKTSILSVVQEGPLKQKFVRVINYYFHAVCLDMHTPSDECITYTANKDIDKTTFRFLEKVTHSSPIAARTEPATLYSRPKKTKSKHKRSEIIPTTIRPSKKHKIAAEEMSEEEIATKAAKLAEKLSAIQALREKIVAAKQRQTTAVVENSKKQAAVPEPLQSSPPKLKRLRRPPNKSK